MRGLQRGETQTWSLAPSCVYLSKKNTTFDQKNSFLVAVFCLPIVNLYKVRIADGDDG